MPEQRLQDLLASTPEQLAKYDIAEMNLLCATGLPGAEDLDIAACMRTLDLWAGHVRQKTIEKARLFHRNRELCQNSESIFRMRILIETLQKDFGVHYNPDRALTMVDEKLASALELLDSRDALLHGLLGPTRAGTCSNMPVLYVAIGRRLGYPVHLAYNPNHVYVRWESLDGKERFNIDGSGSGCNVHPDERYAQWPFPLPDFARNSGAYLRSLTPAEEFALFISTRGWVLSAHRRYAEALPCCITASVYAPKDPFYPRLTARMVGGWLRALYEKNPASLNNAHFRPDPERIHDFAHDPRDLLPPEQAVLALTALGRYYEIKNGEGVALSMYAAAHRMHPTHPGLAANFHRAVRTIASLPVDLRPSMTPSLPSAPAASALPFETRGLQLERAGKLGEAQMMFAEALLLEPTNVPCGEYLHRVVRKQVLDREKAGTLGLMPGRFSHEDKVTRLALRRAVVSAEWARVLASRGHFEDAVLACGEAVRLDPDRSEYQLLWQGVSRMFVQRNPTSPRVLSAPILPPSTVISLSPRSENRLIPKELVSC
ncbi:MAG: hypothetical protein WBD40_07970 [Tepidisphaeraceae bacterium]